MSVGLYMDVHIPRSITNGLRLLAVDVLTAQEDGTATLDNAALLSRATELQRALYSQDDDLLTEAHRRLIGNEPFAGVIYSHQLNSPIGKIIQDLELIAKASEPEDTANEIIFIPF